MLSKAARSEWHEMKVLRWEVQWKAFWVARSLRSLIYFNNSSTNSSELWSGLILIVVFLLQLEFGVWRDACRGKVIISVVYALRKEEAKFSIINVNPIWLSRSLDVCAATKFKIHRSIPARNIKPAKRHQLNLVWDYCLSNCFARFSRFFIASTLVYSPSPRGDGKFYYDFIFTIPQRTQPHAAHFWWSKFSMDFPHLPYWIRQTTSCLVLADSFLFPSFLAR